LVTVSATAIALPNFRKLDLQKDVDALENGE
jgi:hypothetical protein